MIIGIAIALLLIVGMPIAFAIGIPAALYIMGSQIPDSLIVQKIVGATQPFPLLAVPLFMYAGTVMSSSGITRRLLNVSLLAVGWIQGGLAQVTIILSTLMGGVSGSALADAVMQARIFGADMEKKGFTRQFSACCIAFSALITSTIPPSIGLILYGLMSNVSIGRLFVAGFIPGIVLAFALSVLVYFIARKRDYPREIVKAPPLREIFRSVYDAKWAIVFTVMLIAGLRYGVFTPSEAGAFAVVYTVIVGLFLHKELTWSELWRATVQTVEDTGIIMLMIMLSAVLGYILIVNGASFTIESFLGEFTDNSQFIFYLAIGIVLVLGFFVDASVIILLVTPVIVPVVDSAGIDLVQFGTVMMIAVTLGLMTPPVGVGMMAVCRIIGCSEQEFVLESLPFLLTVLVVIILLIQFPALSLALPNLLYG